MAYTVRRPKLTFAEKLYLPTIIGGLFTRWFHRWALLAGWAAGSYTISFDAAQRANARWKQRLAEYEMPPLDEGVHEELLAWIDQRKASFPDSDV